MPLTVAKSIPDQVTHEGAAYKPFDFKAFILQTGQGNLRFRAELADGRPLPQGLICTTSGILSGIPSRGTVGNYEVVVTVQNEAGESIAAQFNLIIQAVEKEQYPDLLRDLKSQIWEAVGKGQPLPVLPEIQNLFNIPVTPFDVYFIMEGFAYLIIWNADNQDPPGKKKELKLMGASPHYGVYDRGSCIVGAPKDLFTHLRTFRDAYVTARAMADEVYKRGWTIEFGGFDKMVRAAWVRLQILGKQRGKQIKIMHYVAGQGDVDIYNKELGAMLKQR